LFARFAYRAAGAEYIAERLSFAANQQQSPEYKAINPKGRVPAVVTDRGVLTETPAILAFIAQSYPRARLAPLDDAFAFAQLQPSTAISAPRFTWPMPTRGAGRDGLMTLPRSPR
jgi:glutathione S-transferase